MNTSRLPKSWELVFNRCRILSRKSMRVENQLSLSSHVFGHDREIWFSLSTSKISEVNEILSKCQMDFDYTQRLTLQFVGACVCVCLLLDFMLKLCNRDLLLAFISYGRSMQFCAWNRMIRNTEMRTILLISIDGHLWYKTDVIGENWNWYTETNREWMGFEFVYDLCLCFA